MAEAVSSISTTDPTQYTAKRSKGELDKNAFLRLLTTQLENQDPLNPASEQEMVGTLAQFTALEQTGKLGDSMEALTKTNQWSQGSTLLGHTVLGLDENGEKVQGMVLGVGMVDDKMILHLDNDQTLPLTGLSAVKV
jgi:flagellar basal-body rod modification protein FlgD